MRVVLLLAAFLLSAPHFTASQEPSPNPRGWLWRFVAGGATVGSGAFADDGTLYFAAEDRYLYAVDRNGTMIWRTDLGRRPAGGAAVGADGAIIVTLDNGELLSLNPDGRLIWRARVGAGRPFEPVLLASGVIITVRAPSVVEARTHTGRLLWSADVESPVVAAPIATGDGTLVVATGEAELVAIAFDGRIIRRRYLGEVAALLAATPGGVLLGSTNGRLIAVDDALEPVWRADIGSAVRTLRVGTEGEIYATTDDGGLSRVTSQGVVAWKAQPGSAAMRSLVAGDGALATVDDGVLTRLGRDGTAVWQMRLLDRPRELMLSPYAAVIVASESWVTYAYAAEFVAEGAWAQARGGPSRRGVGPGDASGRIDLVAFERSADYLALRSLLLAGGQSEQGVAMAGVVSRVRSGQDLTGQHQYLLQLSESVAGSPYFGQLARSGPKAAPRRAREDAIEVIGEIGDLQSSRFLARLLRYEPDTAMQAQILRSMARLGTPVDEALAARLSQIVRRDIARGPSDTLGLAIAGFVAAIDAYRGGYLHPDIAGTLLEVAGANYSRSVREEALATLRRIAGGRAP